MDFILPAPDEIWSKRLSLQKFFAAFWGGFMFSINCFVLVSNLTLWVTPSSAKSVGNQCYLLKNFKNDKCPPTLKKKISFWFSTAHQEERHLRSVLSVHTWAEQTDKSCIVSFSICHKKSILHVGVSKSERAAKVLRYFLPLYRLSSSKE